MTRQTLLSERLRCLILAAMLTAGLTIYLLVAYIPGIAADPVREGFAILAPYALTLVISGIAFELVAALVLHQFIARGATPGRGWIYAGAVVEVSLPTIAILIWATQWGAIAALSSVVTQFYLLFVVFSILRLDFSLCLFTGTLAGLQYIHAAVYLLHAQPPDPATAPPLLTDLSHYLAGGALYAGAGLCSGFVAVRLRRQFDRSIHLLEERNRVVNLFGQHVSPAVVDQLLNHPPGRGELRQVCVMFLDIRGFSAMAERRRPEDLVEYLNTILSTTIAIIHAHRGIVNKMLGDGFMAIFGAPLADTEASRHAVLAALQIVEEIDELNATARIPPTRIGIGLHAGEVVTGTVGSRLRQEYTILGSVVNTASRIEQLNKELGAQILASEAVLDGGLAAELGATDMGLQPIRGHDATVRVYRLA